MPLPKINKIDNAKDFFKFISVWAMIIASAVQSTFILAPNVLIDIWDKLPDDLKSSIPVSYLQFTTVGILALGLYGRVIKQGKAKADELDKADEVDQDDSNK